MQAIATAPGLGAEKPSPFQKDAQRERLRALRDEIASGNAESPGQALGALDWSRMEIQHRAVLLLMAGLDGDDVARKNWREYTAPEQLAIRVQVCSMLRSLTAATSLARRF